MNPRDLLLKCFRAALDAVDARRCVSDHLAAREEEFAGDWHVVAVGKAAGAMTLGARDALGTRLLSGCVVAPRDAVPAELAGQGGRLQIHTAAHPRPDASSLAAGQAVTDFVSSLPRDAQCLFLVSGGASSLVESLREGVAVADLHRVSEWALASGEPIDVVNAVRRRLSRLKGGGLARLAGGRIARALMISDVPGDDPALVGSGLLHVARNSPAGFEQRLPIDVAGILQCADRDPSDREEAPDVPVAMVATVRHACVAAAREARRHGVRAVVSRSRISGPADVLARRFVRTLERSEPQVLRIFGGESTVALPHAPGRGGRNQHLALMAAMELEARGVRAGWLLAAGTDGIDGTSSDAGALVDAGTCLRGRDAGYDPNVSLSRADSGSFLEASGDLLHTGATLTNVGDLVLMLRGRDDR